MWRSWKSWLLTICYFGSLWWSGKNWFFTICYCWQFVAVLKELIFKQFANVGMFVVVIERTHFLPFGTVGSLWWSWKNWFLTVSNLGVYNGHERTDFFFISYFGQFLVVLKKLIFYHLVLWEFVVVMKELNVLPFATVGSLWQSWRNWFFTICYCWEFEASLERTDFLSVC